MKKIEDNRPPHTEIDFYEGSHLYDFALWSVESTNGGAQYTIPKFNMDMWHGDGMDEQSKLLTDKDMLNEEM